MTLPYLLASVSVFLSAMAVYVLYRGGLFGPENRGKSIIVCLLLMVVNIGNVILFLF